MPTSATPITSLFSRKRVLLVGVLVGEHQRPLAVDDRTLTIRVVAQETLSGTPPELACDVMDRLFIDRLVC